MKTLLTATQLFARVTIAAQDVHRCFYCGGLCDDSLLSRDIVRSSFTGLDTVTLSDYVCRGCVEAMQEGIDLTLVDGTQKSNQKIRGYSWIITADDRKACTKAHRQLLLDTCLCPPEPPYVVCISDSGQKHLLYRAVVNWDRSIATVTLEGMPVTYRPHELHDRLVLCKQLCAALGKPALAEPLPVQSQMRLVEHYDDECTLAAWLDCFTEPLTRLAAWLCPPKEECFNEYPGTSANTGHTATQGTFGWFD